MPNRHCEKKKEEENNDDDNVSCVTSSSSKMTLETETTLSSTERELLQLPVLLNTAANNGDTVQFRQLITKYFKEDCMFQSPTMETPVFGIHHIITTLTGIIQNIPDFVISASNIRLMNREVISGTVVTPRCILIERNFVGK